MVRPFRSARGSRRQGKAAVFVFGDAGCRAASRYGSSVTVTVTLSLPSSNRSLALESVSVSALVPFSSIGVA